MKILLWLDDARIPYGSDWLKLFAPEYLDEKNNKIVWVKNYMEFITWIQENGLPDDIGFDHDLGPRRNGIDCAKWLGEYCMDNKLPVPGYFVQSANPVGRKNIQGYLNNLKKHHII